MRCPAIRVLHPVAIHFKGSGFYKTDYGRGKKVAADGRAEASSGDSKSKDGDSKSSDSAKSSDSKTSTGSGKAQRDQEGRRGLSVTRGLPGDLSRQPGQIALDDL